MQPTFISSVISSIERYLKIVIIILAFAVFGLIYLFQPPRNFPVGSIITVEDGETLTTIAKDLKQHNVVHSGIFFQDVVIGIEGERKIMAGDYYLSKQENVYQIAYRLTHGKFDLSPIKVTVPEGSTIVQIADIIASHFPKFDKNAFLTLAQGKEGYLFPDTYFFMPNVKAEEVLKVMSSTFEQKISTVIEDIKASGHSLNEIITLASILEEEAKTENDWQIISGIMWKRITKGMLLQVDATLGYITGKPSSELTLSDLKLQSPYNTYVHKGLPPGPISNPGLDTITAALHPIETNYFFYLSDKNNVIHYAATLTQHDQNIAKYLK